MKVHEMRKFIEELYTRSAWDKGVKQYELVKIEE